MRTLRIICCILFLAGGMSVPRVTAQTPADETVFQDPNANVSISLSQPETFFVRIGAIFGMDLSGIVKPRTDQESTLAIPDLTPHAKWLTLANPYFVAQELQKKINDFKTPQPKTAKYSVCLTQTVAGNTKTATDKTTEREETEPIVWIPPVVQGSETLNAAFGKLQKTPNEEGNLDFDRPARKISEAADCGADNPSELQKPLIVRILTGSLFSETANFKTVLSDITGLLAAFLGQLVNSDTSAVVTRSTVLSNGEYLCNAGTCTIFDVRGVPDDATKLTDNQGFPVHLLSHEFHRVTTPFGGEMNTLIIGEKQQQFQDPNVLTNNAEKLMNRSACSVVPRELQDKVAVGEPVEGDVVGIQKECLEAYTMP